MDQLNEKTDTWRSSRSNYGRLINYDHFRPRVFHINNFWPGVFNHMDNWSGTTPSLVDNVVHLMGDMDPLFDDRCLIVVVVPS